MKLPPRLLLATGNAHKIAEMHAILAELLPASCEIVSLDEIGLASPPGDVERYSTFTANARAKAQWCRDRSGLACIADDSGICVDALDGGPGVRSARWAGPYAGAAERNARLLGELERVGAHEPKQRRGHYACSAAFSFAPQDASQAIEVAGCISAYATMHGHVLSDRWVLMANGGFGYDPLFFADELGMSVAEAGEVAKNNVSHRAKALRRLIAAITASS